MPPKRGKSRGKGATRPPVQAPMEIEPTPRPVSDGEDSGASSTSQTAQKAVQDEKRQYPWKDQHQETLAEFWLNHPMFYDKTLQNYKNREMKSQLLHDFIQKNANDWGKIHTPLPTVAQVDAHLRNMRTRFGKLLKRKSGAPAITLSYTDTKILERYQFLRPHIQRNRTTATHIFQGLQPRDSTADEGDDDDDDQVSQQSSTISHQGSQQPSTSHSQSKGKGKGKHRRPSTPSTIRDSDDMAEAEILQQAQTLISNIRSPTKNVHERRVRDFCRYMESEILGVPETSWDECSFSIMNIIRGFKTGQQHALHQTYGSQYQQQGCYNTQQSGTFQQPLHAGTFQQQQQSGTFQHPGSFQQPQRPGTFQQSQHPQSAQYGTIYTQLSPVSSSPLNTSLGLDSSLSNLWNTSTPVQSPAERQLDTPTLPQTNTGVATTDAVPVIQSSVKPVDRMAEENSD